MSRILVKSVNWVGDAVLVTPFLRILRRMRPEAEITVMARPWVADVFEANPDIDRLWVANETESPRAFLRIARRLRRERFHIGIALPNSFGAALMLRLAAARRRIGYDRDGRRFMLTDPVPLAPAILRVHQVEYYIHLLEQLGDPAPHARELVVPVAPGADAAVRHTLAAHGIAPDTDRPLVGMAPGAAFGTAKRWLPERYARIADHVRERWGGRVVIVGSGGERSVGELIARQARSPVVNLCGAIPLRGLVALCDLFDTFVCNDSGAMHIAAARDVPLVAVFGPTDHTTTAPYSDRAIIVRKPAPCPDNPCMRRHCPAEHKCMRAVSVEDVAEKIDAVLQEKVHQPNAPAKP